MQSGTHVGVTKQKHTNNNTYIVKILLTSSCLCEMKLDHQILKKKKFSIKSHRTLTKPNTKCKLLSICGVSALPSGLSFCTNDFPNTANICLDPHSW